MSSTKSFAIPKRAVFEAWKRVKANRGGAGIDREGLAAFEKNLQGNLYKIWNRMVSGSYFPPRSGRSEYQRRTVVSVILAYRQWRIGWHKLL